MKLFISDESNIAKDDKFGFFVYGGIIVDISESRRLVQGLEKIKELNNIQIKHPIKWNNQKWNEGKIPPLAPETHTHIKNEVIKLFTESNSK